MVKTGTQTLSTVITPVVKKKRLEAEIDRSISSISKRGGGVIRKLVLQQGNRRRR